MRVVARVLLSGLLASLLLAFGVSAAQAASELNFVAANCKTGHETCVEKEVKAGPLTYWFPKKPTTKEAEEGGYTQAAGHPPYGITAFEIKTEGAFPNEVPAGGGIITHIRTDVAPGVSTNPTAVPQCSIEEFGAEKSASEVAKGVFIPSSCKPETVIGVNKVVVVVEPAKGVFQDVPLEGVVYNLQQTHGISSLFGVALSLANVGHSGLFAHTLIEGHVEWAGDYHDYYEINVSPELPLISSILNLKGNIGTGGFITNPSNCAGPGPQTTNTLTLQSTAGSATKTYTTPIGTEGCKGESSLMIPPFVPAFGLTPGAGETQSDQPDGITTELTLPHDPNPEHIDSSQLRNASVTLPEGMTLNPSAAKGLEACAPAQARIHSPTFGVACPAKSELGTVTLDVPDLPPGSLTGKVYLGGPESGPITGSPYTMYINAESPTYGVDVRLQGQASTNETTGQVTATFLENPEQPFSNIKLKFNGGALAPIANPLVCGAMYGTTNLVPYIGSFATATPSSNPPLTIDSNGKGGACSASVLALSQSTSNSNSTAGAYTSYTLNLARSDGQQYLTKVSTTLPEGLLGIVPSLTLCEEAQANAGTCSVASRIGTATVKAGAGSEPYSFSGSVYLTGPYHGAPYGLSIVVPAVAGPFNLGNEVVRATITVNPTTTQLTVTANVPTIKGGIPLRIKGMSVAINREKFMINPTNCRVLATQTLLSGTPTLPPVAGASQGISTPFQVQNCSALAFKPQFSASTSGKTTRPTGASLNVNIGYTAGQANVKYVKTTLPKQLPSRLSTLNKACPVATFNVNPASCPAGATVGTATAITPVLPKPMTGPAMLVSHGSAAFPDLEFVLSGNNVTVIVDGTTDIKNGITTSTFATVPDAPISSFALSLPSGPNSLLAANGNLCTRPLIMPTVLEGQNGTQVTQNTHISASGCGVVISAQRVRRHTAYLTVYVPGAGKVSASGTDLRRVSRKVSRAGTAYTLKVSLSRKGVAALRRRHRLKLRIRVSFAPTKGSSSRAFATVTFR